MGLSYEEVEVSPELAEEWLETMDHNRRVSESNLEAIVLAMNEGRWHHDGDPVRFNAREKMIDGQHRMMGLIATGQTHKFLVVRGIEDEAMPSLNTGKSRSRGDVLAIHDPELRDAVAVAGALTIALRWEKGARGNSLRNLYISNDEAVAFYDEHKEEILHAKTVGGRLSRSTRGVTTQAMSLCAYLFEKLNAEDAAYFWDRVIDGAQLAKGSPILALRRFFERESRTSRENVRADIAAAITIKAWNAYREGRDVELLAFKVGGAKPERYPEPI